MSKPDTNNLERLELDTHQPEPSRLRRAIDTLQDTIRQPVQTVTRNATLNTISTGVEDIDSPDNIPDYVDLYYDTGQIRTNLNLFRNDVVEPGIRVLSPDDATEDYFMGGDNAPEGAPENGYLSECFVIDEKRRPLTDALGISTIDRWRRGTVLLVNIYADPSDPDSIISGCTFVRPETMSARTYSYTNQLLLPDPDAPENQDVSFDTTVRGEVSAWVQFDENSILSRLGRRNFTDRASVHLSQNDLHKLTLDQDVGGDQQEEGVFGESIIRSISDEATQLNAIKRDLEKAVKNASMGFFTLEANDYVIDAGDEKILVEWPDGDIDTIVNDLDSLEPGEVLSTDAKINLNREGGEVPDVSWILSKYTRDIIDPLPAPFYKHSDAVDLNRDIGKDQQQDYQDTISHERRVQSEFYESFLRQVARRHPELEAEGLSVVVEPEQDESPVLSLDSETMDKLSTFASAMSDVYGPGGAPAFVQDQVLNELILQLPEEASITDGTAEMDDMSLDDLDGEEQEAFNVLMNGE